MEKHFCEKSSTQTVATTTTASSVTGCWHKKLPKSCPIKVTIGEDFQNSQKFPNILATFIKKIAEIWSRWPFESGIVVAKNCFVIVASATTLRKERRRKLWPTQLLHYLVNSCSPVWPDTGIKSGPIFTKAAQSIFILKDMFFKKHKRLTNIWANSVREHGSKTFQK